MMICIRNILTNVMRRHFNCKLSIKEEKNLVNEYQSGRSSRILATKYGFKTHVSILKILKHYKINRRTISETLRNSARARKHSLNENFYDILDSEEKTYTLGLFFSDGYVFEKDYKVGITSVDIELLETIKQCLNADNPIMKKRRKNMKNNNMSYL